MEQKYKLTVREKICYGLGDSSANVFLGMTMMFLPYFYTDVLGISAAAMGVLFIVARLVDAFFDPFVGSIADKTRSKHGSYRPFLLYFSIPYGLSCLLVFIAPEFTPTGKLIYAYVTYLFLILMYALTVVPYVALLTTLTADPMERLSTNAWRFPLAKMAFLICSSVVPLFVAWYGKTNEARAYMMAMTFIGILATMMLLACFWGTKERYQAPITHAKISFFKQVSIMLKSKPTVIYFLVQVTNSIAFSIKGSMTIYFVKYFLDRGDLFVSGLLSATAIAGIIAPIFTIHLVKRGILSKLGSLKFAEVGGGIAALCLYFVSPNQIELACVFLFLSVMMTSMGSMTIWALPSDCADACEASSGVKMSGIIAAGTLFSMKVGLALAGGIVGLALAASGYHAGQAVSSNTTHMILFLIAGVPAIFHFITYGLLLFLKFDKKEEPLTKGATQTS